MYIFYINIPLDNLNVDQSTMRMICISKPMIGIGESLNVVSGTGRTIGSPSYTRSRMVCLGAWYNDIHMNIAKGMFFFNQPFR